jgi:hypothetical protein
VSREATLAIIAERREIARTIIAKERTEYVAHSLNGPDDVWEAANLAKWNAFEAAMDVIPGIDSFTSETDIMEIATMIHNATDYALARKWRLSW